VTSFNPFPIQHPRVSVSRTRGAKFKIKNPRVSVSTPYSCRGRERGILTPSSLNPLIPRYCVAAFTLVELLAVIGIMGLLAAVGVPALKGLTGSGGRKQALSQLIGALEIARNTAINTGTNAAVIFPDSTFSSGEAYKYRSMAVVAWNPTNANTNSMIGPWLVLPQGIAFFPNSLKSNNLTSITNIYIRILTNTISGSFPAIVFEPDGSVSTTPTNGIAYFEGTVTNTTAIKKTIQTNFETIFLRRYTGRAYSTLFSEPK